MRLTEANIPKMLPEDGQGEIKDTQVPGLFLRGNRTVASWTVRFTSQGNRRRKVIGKWPAVTLSDARRGAQRLFGELAVGVAPERVVRSLSFADALVRAEKTGYTHLSKPDNYFGTVRRYMGHLMARPLRSITRGDVIDAADRIRPRIPATADQMLRVCKSLWGWWSQRELCENILASVRVDQTRIRDNYLSVDEACNAFRVMQSLPYPHGPVMSLLLLLGARRKEVQEMRKAEVDLDSALWTIPGSRTKNNQPWRIPLGSRSVDILRDAIDIAPEGEFVFSTVPGKPSLGIDKALRKLRTDATIPDFQLHDCRRTIATFLADNKFAASDVDRFLNHLGSQHNSRLSRIYNRSDMLDVRRDMVDLWQKTLCGK